MARTSKRNTGKGKSSKQAAADVVKAIAGDLNMADENAESALMHRLDAGCRIATANKGGVSFRTLSKQLKDAKCKSHGTSVQPLNHMAQVHTAFIAPKDGATVSQVAALGLKGVGIQKLQAWAKVAEAEGPKSVLAILTKDPSAKPPRAKGGSNTDRILIALTAADDITAWRAEVQADEKAPDTLRRLLSELRALREYKGNAKGRTAGSKRQRDALPDRPTA